MIQVSFHRITIKIIHIRFDILRSIDENLLAVSKKLSYDILMFS
jgi:hypothetical protein